ncbi:MAG: sigma-70 family RNA polymerase sigma factor [Labilithrix sp.]|nr:sigma-70 family RNA polymerase sigma factor [Labilithrix sp.]
MLRAATRAALERSAAAASPPSDAAHVTPLTQAALLPLVAGGDRAAVRQCIERYGALVWSLARRARLAQDEAEDVVQEIFLDLWRSAARFDPSVASETTFIAMIARRRLVDLRRKHQRRPETEPLIDSQRATSTMPAPELGAEAAQAARALDQLRPEQRQVLILTACQGLSHEEVAQTTGMPLGTVKAHARRGLMRVREVLGAEAAGRAGAYVGAGR